MTCTAFLPRLRPAALLGWLAVLALVATVLIPVASAAQGVTRTTPIDGEILQRTPTAVGVGFDTPLDRDQSSFRLLTVDGTEVADTNLTWGNNDTSVTIQLPREFADGVYTITWHAVAASDGSTTDGWSSFSVGNPEDANIITIPTSNSGHVGPPNWLWTLARGVAVIGIAGAMAIWPIWRGIIRPAMANNRAAAGRVTTSLQTWAVVAIVIGTLGSLAELAIHALTARDANLIDAVMPVLANTDWGFWWVVRLAMLVLLGIGLAISPWWFARRSRFKNAFLWILSLAMPLPLVFSGHGLDDTVGRTTIVATNHLFLTALMLWAGGALALVIALRSGAANSGASHVMGKRFSWLTVSVALMLLITGSYLGWLFAGNLFAITDTAFGQSIIPLVIAGAISLVLGLVLAKSLPRHAPTSYVLAALTMVMLIAAARMDVNTAGRVELLERSTQTEERINLDGRTGIVLTAPGRAGVNHLRLETPGTYLQGETEVYLDISSASYPELGTKSVQMYRVQGNAYEHHGTEFSLIGDWNVTVRVAEPGFPSSSASYTQPFNEENTSVDLPGPAWKFEDLGGMAGIVLLIVGVLGASTAIFTASAPLRKEAGGLALVAAALAAVVILQGRYDPILAVESGEGAINPNDIVMVQRGEELFNTQCASCHGVGLRGDGPLAEALNPPPTDFAAPHARVHPNADLIYWIQNGIQGTAMPGFRAQLEDQDIRDIIAYIQNWQQDNDGTENPSGTPAVAACEVPPTDFVGIREIFHHGLHEGTRRGTPLVRAADSNVSPERTNEVMWTLEQMVNCANQDQYLSQVRLFTPQLLQEIYPYGATWDVTDRATRPANPVAAEDAISIRDVQSVTYLADGRIAVTVIFDDPAGVGVIPGADPVYQVTLVLVLEDGVWMVDEVR